MAGGGRVADEERANKRNDIILQAKGRTGDGTEEGGRNRSWSGVRRLGDTYAIEIKPKQGWIQLASDVNDLFDLMPAVAETKPNKDTKAEDKREWEAKEQPEPEPEWEQKDQEQQALTRDKCWCRYCNMQLLKVSEWDDTGIPKVVLVFPFIPFDSCTMGKSNVWATTVRWSYSPGMSSNSRAGSNEQ